MAMAITPATSTSTLNCRLRTFIDCYLTLKSSSTSTVRPSAPFSYRHCDSERVTGAIENAPRIAFHDVDAGDVTGGVDGEARFHAAVVDRGELRLAGEFGVHLAYRAHLGSGAEGHEQGRGGGDARVVVFIGNCVSFDPQFAQNAAAAMCTASHFRPKKGLLL
jgi:hypothetical protein